MPNLHDIERRINSVSSTKQITRTMQMVAAAKIRRANERVDMARPYINLMTEMLDDVSRRVQGSDNALLQPHDEKKAAVIIAIVSDRGLAGGFNSNVLRHCDKLIASGRAAGTLMKIIACGKKAVGYYSYRKIIPELSFLDLSADPTPEEAAEIAAYVISSYVNGDIDEVIMVYNHAKNAAEQQLREKTLLPFDTSTLEVSQTDTSVGLSGDVIFEPDDAAVLESLLPSYVRSSIYHALVDSAAAEQGARRNAMMSATDNATEMVETLTRQYNRVRQGAITTEITEIVSGAAALED